MAERNLVLQPTSKNSELVFGAKLQKTILLPFEKQLIETIGCTEDEYRKLVLEGIKRAKTRPAGYELIPDIQAKGIDPTTFFINLAISLVLTGISMLLAPKPKKPQALDQRTLDSITGGTRFLPTRGFESQAELATFAQAIPIIFGKYTGTTGGMLVSPPLVWSRMFSHGLQQGVKLMFAVGEAGKGELIKPDLEGIFIGSGALDAIFTDTFAFYWKGQSVNNNSRIKGTDLQYGTRGNESSGDPESNNDVFACPTRDSLTDEGFCSARSLTNNAEFGVYSPIVNGTPYRVNWRVISIPSDDDPQNTLVKERVKIAGDKGGTVALEDVKDLAMEGIGRNYSIRMGITRVNTTTLPQNGTRFSEVDIVKGQTVDFTIKSGSIDEVYGNNVTVDDINSELDQRRIAADDALQLGEIFQIGKTTFQVTERSLTQWKPTGNDQVIKLKCIDIDTGTFGAKVGLVNADLLGRNFFIADINGPHPTDFSKIPNTDFYPLERSSTGIVRNQRPCDVTEIGLRSKVFQRLTGLCNFQSIPTPDQLKTFDGDKVQLTNGTITTFLKRASVFSIYFREVDTTTWSLIKGSESTFGALFCVIGSNPTEQYNSIRFTHPDLKAYEFKFVPITASYLTKLLPQTRVVRLSSSKDQISGTISSGFQITLKGEKLTIADILRNDELTNKPSSNPSTITRSYPSSVQIQSYQPEHVEETRITSVGYHGLFSTPTGLGPLGLGSAFCYEAFGNADTSGVAVGSIKTFIIKEALPGNEWIKIKYHARRVALKSGYKNVVKEYDPRDGSSTYNGVFNPYFVTEHKFGNTSGWGFYWKDWDSSQPTNPAVGSTGPGNFKTIWSSNVQTVVLVQGNYRYTVDTNGPLPDGSQRAPTPTSSSTLWGIRRQELETHYAASSVNSEWTIADYQIIDSSAGGWALGSTISVSRTISSSNPFKMVPGVSGGLTSTGISLSVRGIVTGDQAKKIIQGWYYEVFGDAESYSAGTVREVTKTLSNPKDIQVKLTATVMDDSDPVWSAANYSSFTDEEAGYKNFKAEVLQNSNTSTDWAVGEEFFITESGSGGGWTNYSTLGAKFKVMGIRSTTTGGVYAANREFENLTQISDISFYGNLIEKSNQNEPEHSVVYVNETVSNATPPTYKNMATAGLALKASRRFTALDQVRVWLSEGIKVKLNHPDDSGNGASNLFTDLVYYLLTDTTAGAGTILGSTDDLINTTDLANTSKFLRQNSLFFDGAIDQPVNIRQWIAENAPNFLCSFVLSDGQLSLKPALPVTPGGDISTGAVTVKQLFTSGNIIEDSFELNYLGAEERELFKAVIRYRETKKNQLPKEVVTTVKYKTSPETAGIESFDLTKYVTSRSHARLVGKYFLALRKHVTHTIAFKTAAFGLDLAAGDMVKVVTEASPYNAANNGAVSTTGQITSAQTLTDGQYNVLYYSPTSNDVLSGSMQVTNMTTSDSKFFNTIFTIQTTTISQNIYLVEQLTLDQDNTVSIVASEFPCDDNSRSKMAIDITDDSKFNFDS